MSSHGFGNPRGSDAKSRKPEVGSGRDSGDDLIPKSISVPRAKYSLRSISNAQLKGLLDALDDL